MANDNIKKLVKRKLIGIGSYSAVYLATPPPHHPLEPLRTSNYSTTASQSVAVKSAYVEHYDSLKVEAHILYELRGCPDIIQCFGTDFSTDEYNKLVYNLLLEFAPAGNLHQLIQIHSPTLPEWEIQWYTYKLLKGLSRIHEEGYVHCDIKPANILVFPSPRSGLNYLKIADFGLAKRQGDYNPTVKTDCCFRCTPLYSSPESLFGEHEPPMDIWALGCTVVEMVTGKPMWSGCENIDELAYNIVMKEVPEMPAEMSEKGKDFLGRCLDKNSKNRWTARMLLDHQFIRECGFEKIDEGKNMLACGSPVGSKWVSSISMFSVH